MRYAYHTIIPVYKYTVKIRINDDVQCEYARVRVREGGPREEENSAIKRTATVYRRRGRVDFREAAHLETICPAVNKLLECKQKPHARAPPTRVAADRPLHVTAGRFVGPIAAVRGTRMVPP